MTRQTELLLSKKLIEGYKLWILFWIALKGTSALASCRAEELSSRFPSVMIRDAAGFTRYLSTEREYQISGGYGAAAIYPLGKGGVLGGLWNMLEQINAGN